MEYYHCFHSNDFRQDEFYNGLGVALEWKTFGHNFTINFTNSKGLGETQFIPLHLRKLASRSIQTRF